MTFPYLLSFALRNQIVPNKVNCESGVAKSQTRRILDLTIASFRDPLPPYQPLFGPFFQALSGPESPVYTPRSAQCFALP